MGIHHAGLGRPDRLLVERLFREGYVQVMIATATLAWGVNLPAHTVIIKGTQVYSPERGSWVELSNQDVLQMLGRAGRPQYDTSGHGVIITSQTELAYYLSLMTTQLAIESQLVSRLPDTLNAEIVLGNVASLEDALGWISKSYLWIRMHEEAEVYGVPGGMEGQDGTGPQGLTERVHAFAHTLVHASLALLDRANLVRYDRRSGELSSTPLGRIASHFYVRHGSMQVYTANLRATSDQMDLFSIFAKSQEFRFLPIRHDEHLELGKLLERVPVPVKDTPDEPVSKINILLQVWISGLLLDGFALSADLVYVAQSASRICRAMLEVCVYNGWARTTRRVLEMCKMVEQRQWGCLTPLRQIRGVSLEDPAGATGAVPAGGNNPPLPDELVRRIERKDFPFHRLVDLNQQELVELFRVPKHVKLLYRAVHCFPKLELSAQVFPRVPEDMGASFAPQGQGQGGQQAQPGSLSMYTRTFANVPTSSRLFLTVQLALIPDFEWIERVYGNVLYYWIFVEDVDRERMLYCKRVRVVRPGAVGVGVDQEGQGEASSARALPDRRRRQRRGQPGLGDRGPARARTGRGRSARQQSANPCYNNGPGNRRHLPAALHLGALGQAPGGKDRDGDPGAQASTGVSEPGGRGKCQREMMLCLAFTECLHARTHTRTQTQ